MLFRELRDPAAHERRPARTTHVARLEKDDSRALDPGIENLAEPRSNAAFPNQGSGRNRARVGRAQAQPARKQNRRSVACEDHEALSLIASSLEPDLATGLAS